MLSQTRRTVIKMLIQLGSAGIVTAVSLPNLSFSGPDNAGLLQFAILGAGLVTLVLRSRTARFQSLLALLIKNVLKQSAPIDSRDYANLPYLSEGYSVVEMEVVSDS